jgi:23S rRNA-/tRNA-specific pseudouridylate synthase
VKENRLMFQSTPVGHGLQAITKYRVLDSNTAAALVECEPATGGLALVFMRGCV